jgi:hypothetical protein
VETDGVPHLEAEDVKGAAKSYEARELRRPVGARAIGPITLAKAPLRVERQRKLREILLRRPQ